MEATDVTRPICTAAQPAPKGVPVFPGARYAHTAHPGWEHPDVDTSEFVVSGGVVPDPELAKIAFRPQTHRQCRHCGGTL